MSVDKDLDSTLKKLVEACDGYTKWPSDFEALAQAKADLIKWAEELVDKVIGLDDDTNMRDRFVERGLIGQANQLFGKEMLRTEQRKTAKDIFKEA